MAKRMLIVLTNPVSEDAEATYNDWYTNQHLPDVLKIEGVCSAIRYKAREDQIGAVQPKFRYAAIYELDTDDVQYVADEIMRRAGTPEMPVDPAMSTDRWRYFYEPVTALGPEQCADDLFMVFTRPVAGREDEFNRWYDAVHIVDVLKVPGIESGVRYRATAAQMATEPPEHPYVALYQLGTDDVAALGKDIMSRAGTPAMENSDTMDRSAQMIFYKKFAELRKN